MSLREGLRGRPRTVTSHVGGQFTAAAGEPIEVVDPASEAVIAHLHEADEAEADAAVMAARNAFETGRAILKALAEEIKLPAMELGGKSASIVFAEEDEAVARANDSDFGLVGHVWTEGLERGLRVSSALRTGTVMVNTPIVRDLRTGFGGYKMSGLGREGARGSRAMFTEEKASIIARGKRRFPHMGLNG